MLKPDRTSNKGKLGANAILGVSIVVVEAAAALDQIHPTDTPLHSNATHHDDNKGNRMYNPGGKSFTLSYTFDGSVWDRDENLYGDNVRCDTERSTDHNTEDSDHCHTVSPSCPPHLLVGTPQMATGEFTTLVGQYQYTAVHDALQGHWLAFVSGPMPWAHNEVFVFELRRQASAD